MKQDVILNGINIGELSFDKDLMISEIKERCIDKGFNFVSIRPRGDQLEQEAFVNWAKYLAENQVYFAFLYATQHPPKGKISHLTAETIEKMKEIAGEYYLGEFFGDRSSAKKAELEKIEQ